MQYVLAVVELRHFERAAERCFVTQSTLSTMIGKFEEEIGIRIFDRRTKPVTITREGREIVEQIRHIVKEIDLLDYKIQALKGEIKGEFKMGIIPTVAPYLLPLFLLEFVKAFPDVKFSIEEKNTAEIQNELKRRRLDIGIVAIPLEEPDLVELPLYSEPLLLFDCHSGKGAEKREVGELDYSRLILLEDEHCLRSQVEQICALSKRQWPLASNFEYKAGSIDGLIRFTKSYQGMTILPKMAALGMPESDRSCLFSFQPPVPVRSIGLVVHKHFVKRRLLEELQKSICRSVEGMFSGEEDAMVLKPRIPRAGQ